LSIRDHSPPNLADFEGEEINDNMLHQLMKLMAFLELSERSDYNPREFCFSYKDFNGGPRTSASRRTPRSSSTSLSIALRTPSETPLRSTYCRTYSVARLAQ
jgi:hypothetical protein